MSKTTTARVSKRVCSCLFIDVCLMRIAWAVLTQGEAFDLNKAFRAQPAR